MNTCLTAGQAASALLHVVALLLAGPAAAEERWTAAGEARGVALESKPTATGYRAFRGAVDVCTDLTGLQRFVADPAHLKEWIPYTESARALPAPGDAQIYYLRTSAPWPFKSRDMVYRLTAEPVAKDRAVVIRLEGLPDALPAQEGAVRMQAAEGRWTLIPGDGRVEVALSLAADPGRTPAFFADRRLATIVGGTLANLAAAFPCADEE